MKIQNVESSETTIKQVKKHYFYTVNRSTGKPQMYQNIVKNGAHNAPKNDKNHVQKSMKTLPQKNIEKITQNT